LLAARLDDCVHFLEPVVFSRKYRSRAPRARTRTRTIRLPRPLSTGLHRLPGQIEKDLLRRSRRGRLVDP
jgi:hypothetical protein